MTDQQFKTKDLYEASFLCAVGKKLVNLEQEGKVFWFVFEDSQSCIKDINAYWQGEKEVNARDFAFAIKRLKDRIFAQQ